VFDRSDNAESHAQRLVREIGEKDSTNTYEPKPRGIAHYSAVMPERCDDCGQTYWTRIGAQWTSHLNCPGAPRKAEAGF